jgi:hypothetical protein
MCLGQFGDLASGGMERVSMNSGYTFGATLGRLWARIGLLGKLTVLIGAAALAVHCSTSDKRLATKEPPPIVPANPAAEAARERGALQTKCRAAVATYTATYESLFKQRRYLEAANFLRECAEATGEPAFSKAVAAADIADYQATADDPKESIFNRILSLEKLRSEHPEAYKSHAALHVRLEKQQAAAVAAEKRKNGVSIGMSKEEVLASSWGKPRKINSSHYAWGTHEQWVYDGGYLYFEKGILTSIQN